MMGGITGNQKVHEGGKRNKYAHIKYECTKHGSITERRNGNKHPNRLFKSNQIDSRISARLILIVL